jgi:hypothetical protein
MMARDFVLGKKNEWEGYYASSRSFSLKSLMVKGRDYGLELIGGALKNTFTQNKQSLEAHKKGTRAKNK